MYNKLFLVLTAFYWQSQTDARHPNCPSDGYFPTLGTCNSYTICLLGQPTEYPCNRRAVYSPETRSCVRKTFLHRCMYFRCFPKWRKYAVYPGDRRIYALCVNKRPVALEVCPEGLEFDEKSSSCKFQCRAEGKVPDPWDCTKYRECTRKFGRFFVWTVQTCPPMSWYDPELQNCSDENLDKCSKTSGTTTESALLSSVSITEPNTQTSSLTSDTSSTSSATSSGSSSISTDSPVSGSSSMTDVSTNENTVSSIITESVSIVSDIVTPPGLSTSTVSSTKISTTDRSPSTNYTTSESPSSRWTQTTTEGRTISPTTAENVTAPEIPTSSVAPSTESIATATITGQTVTVPSTEDYTFTTLYATPDISARGTTNYITGTSEIGTPVTAEYPTSAKQENVTSASTSVPFTPTVPSTTPTGGDSTPFTTSSFQTQTAGTTWTESPFTTRLSPTTGTPAEDTTLSSSAPSSEISVLPTEVTQETRPASSTEEPTTSTTVQPSTPALTTINVLPWH